MTQHRLKFLFTGLTAALLLAFYCVILLIGNLSPIQSRLTSWPSSSIVRDHSGQVLDVALSEDGEYRIPVLLCDMGKWFPEIVIQTEDRRFRSHCGVDFARIISAAAGNILRGKVKSGASTITSQIVRLCLPAERTWKTKIREFAQAYTLERKYSKDELLCFYLNTVPLGGNIRGIEAAARARFGRSASDLSLAQAALLAGMIKGPTAYRPDIHPQAAKARRDFIIHMLLQRKIITEKQAEKALIEPIPEKTPGMPHNEHIFCSAVRKSSDRNDITSTLDRELQGTVRSALEKALAPFAPEVTAAAVLIENSTGAIRAYVGNARELTGNVPAYQVDCAASLRSPGSALKPFVYACAVEDGTVTPATLIADTPLNLNGDAPRNFDRVYRGPVNMATALTASLNVPAVRVLHSVTSDRFLRKLRSLGFSSITMDASHYGDSLILGGCEVTPLQLAQAATALANKGELIRASFSESEKKQRERIFLPEAAQIITNVLADSERLPVLLRSLDGNWHIAFKTGTSYGLRDAWTVAWNNSYTLTVWLGDPAGEPHKDLVGLQAATPPVIDIFRHLAGNISRDIPDGCKLRHVCSLSGLPSNGLCPHTVEDLYIPGISREGVCSIHRRRNGKTVTVWPPELAGFMNAPQENRCILKITSPRENCEYLIDDKNGKILFQAEGSGRLSWFIDNIFTGYTNDNNSLFCSMPPGSHTVSVMDETGQQRRVTFKVQSHEGNTQASFPDLIPLP